MQDCAREQCQGLAPRVSVRNRVAVNDIREAVKYRRWRRLDIDAILARCYNNSMTTREEMTMDSKTYQISYPRTPGGAQIVQQRGLTLRQVRAHARLCARRRDLTLQDVRIERPDGSLVEYAGPCR